MRNSVSIRMLGATTGGRRCIAVLAACQPSGVRKGKRRRDVARWERIHAWCSGPQGLNGTMREHACQGCTFAFSCSFAMFGAPVRRRCRALRTCKASKYLVAYQQMLRCFRML